jgi:hypothetical protein
MKSGYEGLGCPICRVDLLDGYHEVRLTVFAGVPLKIVICPKVPSGMAWSRTGERPFLRLDE